MQETYMPSDIHPMDEEEINYRFNKYMDEDYVPSDIEDDDYDEYDIDYDNDEYLYEY